MIELLIAQSKSQSDAIKLALVSGEDVAGTRYMSNRTEMPWIPVALPGGIHIPETIFFDSEKDADAWRVIYPDPVVVGSWYWDEAGKTNGAHSVNYPYDEVLYLQIQPNDRFGGRYLAPQQIIRPHVINMVDKQF